MDPSKWSVIPRHAIVSALSAFLHPSLSRAILTAHNTPAQIHNHLHIDLAGALLDRSHPGYQTLRRHLRSVLFDTLAVDPDTSETTYAMPPPLPPRSHPRPKTPPAPILPHPPSSTHPPNPPPPATSSPTSPPPTPSAPASPTNTPRPRKPAAAPSSPSC